MQIRFSFNDSEKRKTYFIKSWSNYHSTLIPSIGDIVCVKVLRQGEENSETNMEFHVSNRIFFSDGDIELELNWS